MFIITFLLVCSVCGNLTVMAAPSLISSEIVDNEVVTYNFPFLTRAEWQARPPRDKLLLPGPVPFVVIHHSYSPPACSARSECSQAMRSMQNFHMDDRKWWDIGYNFAVGGDGAAYEGRGWTTIGAHSLHFNNVSIGICLIGDWSNTVPPVNQLKTAQALIEAGVEMGYLKSNYKVVGHRQVRETDCPGNALYEEIKHWKHFVSYPSSVKDLAKILLSYATQS